MLVAPPGAGKTTRVPPALLEWGVEGRILVLQPRRVAARMTARRMAAERGESVGDTVGYSVRFDRRVGAGTRIEVLTEGLLIRRLQADPFLDGVGAVVLDEFHERSLHADLTLALLAEVRADARPDLQLVVMSATLDPGPVSAFLGNCPVVHAAGRCFEVSIHYDPAPDDRRLPVRVAAGVRRALAETDGGHVLAFLPGVGEIRAAAELLDGVAAEVLPLHGRLPPDAQDAALAPAPHRKVVLATNIAETSVTLEGVVAVVDAGTRRAPRFDPGLGVEVLEEIPISKASAEQRAGRAGRTGPGRCYRLWTRRQHPLRPDADAPEIARLDLAGALLELLAWGADPAEFPWMEPPPSASVARASALLDRLGATDDGELTTLGRQMATLPVHPRLARVVVEGERRGCLRAAAGAAALASERDPWAAQAEALLASGQGDLTGRLDLLDARGRTGAHPAALRGVRQVRDQLVRLVGGPDGHGEEADMVACLVAGFPDRVAQRRAPQAPRVLLASGSGATLDPPDQVAHADTLVAVQLTGGRRGLVVRLAAPVDPDALPATAETVVEWDAAGERVRQGEQRRFGALVLSVRDVRGPGDTDAAAHLLAEHARLAPGRALSLDDAAPLLRRVAFLAHHRPDLALPPLDLDALIPQLCVGRRSFAELRRLDLRGELLQRLSWDQRKTLDRLAPERWTLPSGSTAALTYGAPDVPPVLAARIQQLFGHDATPAVLGGRVPVMLHLLAPNHRPAQVTRDLPGFWRGSYAAVRKELRGRYPKHSWPEDPLAARPEDRPRRKR